MLWPISIAIILAGIYFYSRFFYHHLKKQELKLVSFSAGVFITYFFLALLPALSEINSLLLKENAYFITLWGFLLLHIFEAYIPQHSKKQSDSRKNILRLRMLSHFVNYLFVGFFIAFFFKTSIILGMIFAIPLILHMLSSAVLAEEPHSKFHETLAGRLVSSSSLILGAVLVFLLSGWLLASLFAFGVGIVLYVLLLGMMRSRSDVFYFIYGVIGYFLIIGFTKLALFLL